MNIHKNARLTRHGRQRLVDMMRSGLTPQAAARAAGVSPRTARKWRDRFQAEGPAGLADRSSRPHRLRQPTPRHVREQIIALRRKRLTGQHIARSLGVSTATVSRVMTDNGSCYTSRAFAKACKALGLKHIRTKPYTPRTNGKAERFIQTALREWAYARAYQTSDQRPADLPRWTHMYNWHRPHSALSSKPPISRLGIDEDNLLTLHS